MINKKVLLFLPLLLLVALACGLIPTAAEDSPDPVPAGSTPLLPTNKQQTDISGDYTVLGINPDGDHYAGEANITKAGDGYTIRWIIADESFHGLGKFDGQNFSVDWEAEWGTGEAFYTRTADGSLSGTWTIDGGSGKGVEELTPKYTCTAQHRFSMLANPSDSQAPEPRLTVSSAISSSFSYFLISMACSNNLALLPTIRLCSLLVAVGIRVVLLPLVALP
jgi:hypothetical protein